MLSRYSIIIAIPDCVAVSAASWYGRHYESSVTLQWAADILYVKTTGRRNRRRSVLCRLCCHSNRPKLPSASLSVSLRHAAAPTDPIVHRFHVSWTTKKGSRKEHFLPRFLDVRTRFWLVHYKCMTYTFISTGDDKPGTGTTAKF